MHTPCISRLWSICSVLLKFLFITKPVYCHDCYSWVLIIALPGLYCLMIARPLLSFWLWVYYNLNLSDFCWNKEGFTTISSTSASALTLYFINSMDAVDRMSWQNALAAQGIFFSENNISVWVNWRQRLIYSPTHSLKPPELTYNRPCHPVRSSLIPKSILERRCRPRAFCSNAPCISPTKKASPINKKVIQFINLPEKHSNGLLLYGNNVGIICPLMTISLACYRKFLITRRRAKESENKEIEARPNMH